MNQFVHKLVTNNICLSLSLSLSLILSVLCSYFCLDKFNQKKGKRPLETEIYIKEIKNKKILFLFYIFTFSFKRTGFLCKKLKLTFFLSKSTKF